jgi:hypothetical protein
MCYLSENFQLLLTFLSLTLPYKASPSIEMTDPEKSPTGSPLPSRVRLVIVETIRLQSTITIIYAYYAYFPSPRPLVTVLVSATTLLLQTLLVIGCHLCLHKYYAKDLYEISSSHSWMDYYVPKSTIFAIFDIIRAVFSCSEWSISQRADISTDH